MQEIAEHVASNEQWTRLFSTQEYTAHIVRILQLNNIIKGRVNQVLNNGNIAWKGRARNKHFQYLGYN